MDKFDITDWIDFVRGVADPETEESRRAHFDSAPAATRSRVEALRRVADLGRSDYDDPVPAHAVRIAKAIASVQRPAQQSAASSVEAAQRPFSLFRRLRLAITFDSLLEPATAGTRNLAGNHRQIVLQAGDYRVDLQLEHELEPRSTIAVGQVTSTKDASRTFPRVPVLVFAGQDEIRQTLTSRHGEFQFEGLPRADLELCVVVGEDFLEMPLETSMVEEAGS